MKTVSLPSGATLVISDVPWEDAKALHTAVLKELRSVPFKPEDHRVNLFKEVFCAGFTSAEIDACLTRCFARCTYDGGKGALKIDKDTFEPVKAREDYISVCLEVLTEVLTPFGRSLFAEYNRVIQTIESIQK